jgi:hypothetical protein
MSQLKHNTKAFTAGVDAFIADHSKRSLREALDHLEAGFWMEAVNQYGSIAAASKHLNVSRSAISKRVNRFVSFRSQEPK